MVGHFDHTHPPLCSHVCCVTDRVEVLFGIGISHDAQIIRDHQIVIQTFLRLKLRGVRHPIAEVLTFNDLLDPYAWALFDHCCIADFPTKLRHFELAAGLDRVGLDGDGAVGLGESAGATGLHQILLLVVVDVEVVEHGNSAALVGTNGVVGQVDNDAHQAVDVGLGIGLMGHLTGQTLHDGNGHDLAHAQSSAKLFLGLVQTMADAVLEKQHVGEHLFGGVESGIAAALVVLAGLDALTNEFLGELVIIVVGD